MDTSDSEYFESADEDIQSEDEITEKLNKIGDTINREKRLASKDSPKKEEELCKLTTEALPKEVNNEKDARIKIGEIGKDKNTEKDKNIVGSPRNSQEVNISNVISKIENVKIEDSQNVENVIDTSKESVPRKNKSKLGSKISKDAVQFEVTPKKKTPEAVEIKGEEQVEGKKDKVTKIVKDEILDVKDENLWDDDEMDWGAEAELEKEVKPNAPQWNVQNQKRNIVHSPASPSQNLGARTEEIVRNQSDSWGGWGTWGASVLSTATQSVSSITTQLTNVIETGLGAVDPEELAKIDREEKIKLKESLGNRLEKDDMDTSEVTSGSFGLGNLVKLVENTGTKVISGGLDTLETIGKKTMEVLQEGDPGLKKKRAFLKIEQDKPVLSQILREAKERAEQEHNSERSCTRKTKNYETLFDDHHGLVHLEALELLSKQCEIKLRNIQNSLNGEQYTEFMETMDQIKELSELPDLEDEPATTNDEISEILKGAVTEMNIQISYEKLVSNWEETEIWLSTLNLDICDEIELHQQAIETLAQVTSMGMEQFHKIAELLLIKEQRHTGDEATNVALITATLINLIEIVAAKFSEKLNSKISDITSKEVSGLITNVFFEAANSSTYIQDALQLLVPVVQVGAI